MDLTQRGAAEKGSDALMPEGWQWDHRAAAVQLHMGDVRVQNQLK